jgi:hypothetical protein
MLLGESLWRRPYVPGGAGWSHYVDKRSRSHGSCVNDVLAVYAQANLLQIMQGIWACGPSQQRLGASSWYVYQS